MRRIFVVAALVVISATSSAASVRNEVYAQQLDCTTQETLDAAVAPLADLQAQAAQAAEACVTTQDMKASYTGFLKYEYRNPETVRKEHDERKAYLVQGALRRIESCRNQGVTSDRLAADCVVLFKGKKDETSSSK
jgi:hypothetical protein